MLDNVRRKRSQVSADLYKSVFLRLCAFSSKVLKLNLGKLRLSEKATKSFRYFGQGHLFSSEECSIENVEFKMLACSAGTFIMGHLAEGNNKPRPEIIERPFLLGDTEITQGLYEAVMGTNPSEFQNDSQNPVEQVSWGNAILFCNALSKLQGLDECYILRDISTIYEGYGEEDEDEESYKYEVTCDFSKNGYRLPTEKEWEYAAKAGTDNEWAGTGKKEELVDYAVYDEGQTHPVKTKKPNEWGFYDMSGNVFEWCWDKYDPDNPKPSADRVMRGGSWIDNASYSRSARRTYESPSLSENRFGFRVCRTLV